MKITMKIQHIRYGDVAVQALPVLAEKLPAEDTAMNKLLRAITHLPEDVVYSLFDAISQQEKNEIVSLLVQENKEKILAYATQFLQEQQIGLTLQNLAVTSDLAVELDVLDIDYGSLVQKLLPLIQDKLFESYGAAVRIVYLETSWQEQLRRNANREAAVPETAISHMLEKLSPPEAWEADHVIWLGV